MQSELLNELLNVIDSKIFTLTLQLIIVGAVFMWIKNLNGQIVDYYRLKMSDLGRGTKVEILGYEGFISRIGFNEVEITLDGDKTLLIPVDKFMQAPKVIVVQGPRAKR